MDYALKLIEDLDIFDDREQNKTISESCSGKL